MKNKFLSYSIIAAIIAAIFYFLNSVVNLIGYAVSNNMLSRDSSPIIQFIINNYKNFNLSFTIILLLTSLVIYLSFIFISKKQNKKYLMISSILLLLAIAIPFILSLLVLLNINPLSIFPSRLESYAGIFFLLFGISLIFSKLNNRISKLLGTFYILESLILLSSLALPIRLAEFTIAIKITEAFFFFEEKSLMPSKHSP